MGAIKMTPEEASAAAAVAYGRGNYALALELYDEALLDSRSRHDAREEAKTHANRSACLCELERYEEALAVAERAVARDSTFVKGHSRRAAALRGMREYARARECLKTCMELAEGEGAESLREEIEKMARDMDAQEAKGEQAARVGMQMNMGTAPQTKPHFAVSHSDRAKKRVSFDPKLDVDCDDEAPGGDIAPATPGGEPTSSKPLLMELGANALDESLRMHNDKTVGRPSEEFEYKRCKMCGNVCHVMMTSCSSCCLPLVSASSYEPATLPRVGEDANAYEESDDSESDVDAEDLVVKDELEEEIEDAFDDDDPWWVRHFGKSALKAPEHRVGLDPSLKPHYEKLGLPFGSDETKVRAAYRAAVVTLHPDSGGSSKGFKKLHDAYDALLQHFWRHDAGAEKLRLKTLPDDNEDIFVVLDVYRNREAEHTLKRLFSRASNPERVFVGVTWQYKTTTPPPDSLGAQVDRLHDGVRRLTERVTEYASEIKNPEEQDKYLRQMRRRQLKLQRAEDAEEKRCHSRNVLEVRFRDHVRESHAAWDETDGPSYAKHVALRKWGGEKYVLHIDAMTVLDENWDQTLVEELKRCENSTSSEKCVLTAAPLAYKLKTEPVIEEETLQEIYKQEVYGTVSEELPSVHTDADVHPSRAPALVCAHRFARTLCHMNARQIEAPKEAVPTLFASSVFAFARAEAFVRDAPPDPHAPFLYLGEELSLTARLWTRGWDLYAPPRVPVLHCYEAGPRFMWAEDRRRGKLLYGAAKLRWGSESELEQRDFLNLASRRRILQLIGAPHEDSATSKDDPVIFTKTYGLGSERSRDDFLEMIGIDFEKHSISSKAQRGGYDGKFIANSESLPKAWRGSRAFENPWTGPPETCGLY